MKGEIDAGVAHAPERVTIREFLSWFSYTKRGSWINRHIRNKMEELDLRTVPDFESGWFGATISIGLDPEAVAGLESSDESVDPTVRIGTLEAANRKPTSVKPDNPLKVATTLMQLSDFSQLPVMTGEYNVKGVISWKSIGTTFFIRARVRTSPSLHGPGLQGDRYRRSDVRRHRRHLSTWLRFGPRVAEQHNRHSDCQRLRRTV